MNDQKYRHEYKSYISMADMFFIIPRLRCIAAPDENMKNGSYFVRSLYFDNYADKALREKINGVSEREKFRIRFYNMDDSFIRLEKKSKHRGLCKKQSAPLSRKQTEMIISGEYKVLADSEDPLHNELYSKLVSQCLRPRLTVDYTRQAYVYPMGNVRVTFDSRIHSSAAPDNFFSPAVSPIPVGGIIMEIKYDEFLPQIIADITELQNRQTGSFSKYAAGRYI